MKAVILQPGYLPWLGFFDQLAASDIFVIYDDVQYDKHGWRNRNKIKTPQGAQYLTVPVLTKGLNKPMNMDVCIDNKTYWQSKHIKSIYQNYNKSPYFKDYFYKLENIFSKNYNKLIELNMKLIYFIAESLKINTKIIFSSTLGIKGEKSERVLNICLALRAKQYLTGDLAKNYLNEESFLKNNIKLIYHNYKHPVYNQLYGDFIPHLSVIDLLFNHGQESLKIIANESKVI